MIAKFHRFDTFDIFLDHAQHKRQNNIFFIKCRSRKIFKKMNLFAYLNTVKRLWNNADGGVARFVSLSGNHVPNTNLHLENPEGIVSRHIEAPLEDILVAHLKVLFYLHQERECLSF
jgi:hypothetical protein